MQIKTLARALRGAISTLESTMKRNEPVRKIMTSNPVTVQLGQSVAEAYKMLLEYDFHHVPVLDGKKLVGLITSTDIARAVALLACTWAGSISIPYTSA